MCSFHLNVDSLVSSDKKHVILFALSKKRINYLLSNVKIPPTTVDKKPVYYYTESLEEKTGEIIVENGHHTGFDVYLWTDLMRSLFSITLMIIVIFWIYRREVHCCDCTSDVNSVWMCLWRFREYKQFILSKMDIMSGLPAGMKKLDLNHHDLITNEKHIKLLATPPSPALPQDTISINTGRNIFPNMVFEETTAHTRLPSETTSTDIANNDENELNMSKDTTLLIAGSSVK